VSAGERMRLTKVQYPPLLIHVMLRGVTRTQAVIAVVDDEPQGASPDPAAKDPRLPSGNFAAGEELPSPSARGRYGCVVLDLFMPGLDGFDVLGRRFAQEGMPGLTMRRTSRKAIR
jgi:CheY-like chemotaxis protein